ncbi:MAG: CopG family transcriptional regulator [Anaerolineales bacterium]|nr:CopG family transcriptional regulator [Anaerolineales bacterium]
MTQFVTKTSTPPTTAQTFIKVHLSPSLKQQLQELAKERTVSLSSLMRIIATEYIKAKR